MSLILDALRRADAERGRGAVPGLHTPQAVPVAPLAEERSRLPLAGAVALVAVLAAVGAGVWWTGRAGGASPAAVPVPPAPAAAVPAAPVAPVAPVAPAPVAPVAAVTAPVPAPAPPPAVPPPVVEAQPVDVLAPPPPPAPAASAAKPAPTATPAPVAAPAPAPTPAASAAPAPVPQLQDLPASARQQLPQLSVSGASYSSNPAYRMVIVNGQVLHEGDLAAPGVILESIAPHQVVLRGHGQRWSAPY
ncbi:GspB domain-containing protein [Xylophilus rhododendri]|uniref:GspB domain-containing protein n=1 Tax=Xylophilus rhododendri TaxID=2697032 RepID=A0A857J708_9BURK|nr:general secretion pathway protein GspB [Xylophilus rhododendri]QHI98792.1 GspB domain-containing protein [Xylophilus rhododendri]